MKLITEYNNNITIKIPWDKVPKETLLWIVDQNKILIEEATEELNKRG